MNQVSKIIILIIIKKNDKRDVRTDAERGERKVERILFYFYLFLPFFLRSMEIGS